MATINTNLSCNLQQAVKAVYLDGIVFSQDNMANQINVSVYNGNTPAVISGTVSANIIRSDGVTVVATNGSINGNVASITLPEAAYYVPGVISIIVKLTTSSVVTTLAVVIANVYQSSTASVADPGTIIPSVSALLIAIDSAVASIPADYSDLWLSLAPAFDTGKNYVQGQYVTYDSNVYRFTKTHSGAWSASDAVVVNLGAEITSAREEYMQSDLRISSLNDFESVKLVGLTLGKSLASGGQYTDAAYGYDDKRAASMTYFCAGDYIKVGVLAGHKVEIDFYDKDYTYISNTGWITSETILKSIGVFFRVLVGGDSSIASNYNSIATISVHGNLSKTFDNTNELIDNFGAEIALNGWIEGKFPEPDSGSIWDGAGYKYAPMVDIIGGATYKYTGVFDSVCGAIFYDETKTIISGAGTYDRTFTAPQNARYADIGTKGLSTTPHLYCEGREWNIESAVNETESVSFTQVSGVVGPSSSVETVGAHTTIDVKQNEEYLVTGHTYSINIFPLVMFYNGTTLLSYENGADGDNVNYRVRVPKNANKMLVNGKPYQIAISKCIVNVRDGVVNLYKRSNNLYNFSRKKIVWFGTSIPANGWFGDEHPNAYPQQVGRLINADVINEAIGSSSISCTDPARITDDNPYGFGGNFEGSSRCLTNSLTEMQWIIDNWDSDIWTQNRPDEMTEWLANEIKNCSYERKIDKYLTAQTFPDLFVFDHGFNDSDDVNNYYETYGTYTKYCFRGGMNFLIKRILDYNPYANIIMIGNYTTTRQVPQMQEAVATDWAIPICKQWEYLGLSLTQNVSASGYWEYNSSTSEYEWVADGTSRTYSVRDLLVPDHIHPHSNPTGLVVKKMAEGIAKWITSNIVGYNSAE